MVRTQICIICKKEFRFSPLTRKQGKTCSPFCGEENKRRTQKKWYDKNREKSIIRVRNWRNNNLERAKENGKRSELKNRIGRQKRQKIYRETYPERIALSQRKQYYKDIELRKLIGKLYRSKQELFKEVLESIGLTVPPGVNPITVIKELGIDVKQLMENIDVN